MDLRRRIGGVALMAAVVAATLPACGDKATLVAKRDVHREPVRIDAKSAANGTTAILNDKTFAFPNVSLATYATPAEFAALLRGSKGTTMTFHDMKGSTGTVQMRNPYLKGTVQIGSLRASFDPTCVECPPPTPAPPPGPAPLPPVGFLCSPIPCPPPLPTPISFFAEDCELLVDAKGVSADGVQGTVTLSLNGKESQPVPATVTVDANNRVNVDGTPTEIVAKTATGSI